MTVLLQDSDPGFLMPLLAPEAMQADAWKIILMCLAKTMDAAVILN